MLSILLAAGIMVALPAHTAMNATGPQAQSTALYRVGIQLTGANATAFYFYATNVATGEFYEFDYYEDAYLLPAGTYIFGGQDATGSGWCGVSSKLATINCNTTVTLTVWCE